jgi:hypothetical protein
MKRVLLFILAAVVFNGVNAQSDSVTYIPEKTHTSKFWRSTLKSFGVGFAATQSIPTGSFTYGVKHVSAFGFDVHLDLSEFVMHFLHYSAPMKEKRTHVIVGSVFTFGNYGRLNNFHSVTVGDTTTTYSLVNDLNIAQVYVELEKTTKWLNPFVRLNYFVYEQNLKELSKETIKNATTNASTRDSYFLTDELSRGVGFTLGLKYRYNFKNNASVTLPVSVGYMIGSPVYTADMNQVQIVNAIPFYEVRKQTPQLVTLNAAVCYNF